jgi:hypothetical protein
MPSLRMSGDNSSVINLPLKIAVYMVEVEWDSLKFYEKPKAW